MLEMTAIEKIRPAFCKVNDNNELERVVALVTSHIQRENAKEIGQ